jgi:hypothetical protein
MRIRMIQTVAAFFANIAIPPGDVQKRTFRSRWEYPNRIHPGAPLLPSFYSLSLLKRKMERRTGEKRKGPGGVWQRTGK